MSFHSLGIHVNAIGGLMLRRCPYPDGRELEEVASQRRESHSASLLPEPLILAAGSAWTTRQAVSVRPRLLRFLPAVHDSNATMG